MASPSTVITMGFGNGTLAGSPSLVITLGYGGAAAADLVDGPPILVAGLVYKPGGAAGKNFLPGAQKGTIVKDQ